MYITLKIKTYKHQINFISTKLKILKIYKYTSLVYISIFTKIMYTKNHSNSTVFI